MFIRRRGYPIVMFQISDLEFGNLFVINSVWHYVKKKVVNEICAKCETFDTFINNFFKNTRS